MCVAAFCHVGEHPVERILRPAGADVQLAYCAYHGSRQKKAVFYFEPGRIDQFRSHVRLKFPVDVRLLRAGLVLGNPLMQAVSFEICAGNTRLRRLKVQKRVLIPCCEHTLIWGLQLMATAMICQLFWIRIHGLPYMDSRTTKSAFQMRQNPGLAFRNSILRGVTLETGR